MRRRFDDERIRHLGRILTGHHLDLRVRAASAVVLLYAQPFSRVVRLTLDDVIRDDGEVLLRLGEPPTRCQDRSPISCCSGSAAGTT